MTYNNIIKQLAQFSQKPPLFTPGTGSIWTEPYIAEQMLKAHLNLKDDGASRKGVIIDNTIEFINTVIHEGSTILDLGCGPGLYAEKLCKKGHKVTGIDFSDNSIRYARNSAKKQGLEIEYVYDNIFSLDAQDKYDVVMQIYGEINTFSVEERNKLFDIVKKALLPEGTFIFEVSTPAHHRKNKLSKNWFIREGGFWREGSHVVFEEGFEYEDNIWLDQYIVMDETDISVYRNWFHGYTREQIASIILEHGFRQVQVFDNVMGEEVNTEVETDSKEVEWLTVIAKK